MAKNEDMITSLSAMLLHSNIRESREWTRTDDKVELGIEHGDLKTGMSSWSSCGYLKFDQIKIPGLIFVLFGDFLIIHDLFSLLEFIASFLSFVFFVPYFVHFCRLPGIYTFPLHKLFLKPPSIASYVFFFFITIFIRHSSNKMCF